MYCPITDDDVFDRLVTVVSCQVSSLTVSIFPFVISK